MKILMDLNPAFFGYAGVQQEVRLLFKMFARAHGVETSGLVFSPSWSTPTVPSRQLDRDKAAYYKRVADFIAALGENISLNRHANSRLAQVRRYAGIPGQALSVILKSAAGVPFPLFEIDSAMYADFLWQKLFSPTLSEEDRAIIVGKRFFATSLGRYFMHGVGMCGFPYPELDSSGFDAVIAHTAFPCRLFKGTRLIIRHQDAIPLSYPAYNPSRRDLFITQYLPLRYNLKKSNAVFVCNSEPTKEDFVRLFPEAEARSFTIPCVISDRFYKVNSKHTIPRIVGTRSCSTHGSNNAFASADRSSNSVMDYILTVASLDPRKNYLTVIRAWEEYRLRTGQDLKLVAVASKGWKLHDIREAMEIHRARGNLFHLENVPVEELRILYSHAKAALSASYAEGFDIPGVEAMLCECPVVASDIKTHRWVYGEAALYFNPDSAASLCDALEHLLHRDQATQLRHELTRRGLEIARRYQEDAVRPMWEDLLARLGNRKHALQKGKTVA